VNPCRLSIPPVEQRSWLTLAEAARVIGCSKATLHRLRRGEIDGVPRLPTVQLGKRKWVVLKTSLAQWQHENERVCAA
jgi:Helix-turn-helix domain